MASIWLRHQLLSGTRAAQGRRCVGRGQQGVQDGGEWRWCEKPKSVCVHYGGRHTQEDNAT